MRKVLFLLFFFFILASLVTVEARWGHRWERQYGCRGKGCHNATYIPESDKTQRTETDANGRERTVYVMNLTGEVLTRETLALNKDNLDIAQCSLGTGSKCVREINPGVYKFKDETDQNNGMSGYFKIIVEGTKGSEGTVMFGKYQYQPRAGGGGDGGDGGEGGGEWVIVTLTPSPTPTPIPTPGPWSKLKDSSFISGERIQSYIPASPVAYDSDDTTEPYFIIGDGGAVSAPSLALKGLNSNAKANVNDWQDPAYDMIPPAMRPQEFISYVRGRKEYKTITSLDQIDADGIYFYQVPLVPEGDEVTVAPLEIASVPASFNQYNVVLITESPVKINVADDYFLPAKSIAIVSPIINFAPNVKEAKGIFISVNTDSGETEDQGLKIIGNLIVNGTFTDGRKWTNLNRPSLFVVFRPDMYLDLLPYLSVASYEWQQQQ